ncbi:nucleotidyltransferase domain-containing protein [Polycladomyces subterraneus]|uniref:Aminoglycoside-2''-adenylyltransferase n=1 Tax=Polycladomyces subterraneus TaxID=1016997 RepID=A0ABT8IQR3_9BACL|nr:hypothetical protein [Polycladomyces subterraneus]MDN4595075.1 hypothetical protein [Polycladomyces subterraneus]
MNQTYPFHPIDQVLSVMKSFDRPWFVSGGWALDLSVGRVTREHGDLDLTIFREDTERLIQYFDGWTAYVAIPGERRYEIFRELEDVRPPRHELVFQKGDLKLEFLLIDRDGDKVLFRRSPVITLDIQCFAQQDGSGRPHVAPEWQLLFKAKNPRPKDEQDFANHFKRLGKTSREWLLNALKRYQPDSHWIALLESDE